MPADCLFVAIDYLIWGCELRRGALCVRGMREGDCREKNGGYVSDASVCFFSIGGSPCGDCTTERLHRRVSLSIGRLLGVEWRAIFS